MHSIVSNQTANTLRFLSAEAVQAAKSGHPGLPLGAAPMALAVWGQMKASPKNPSWKNRDRFVLSAGHGSSLLYSLLHVFGYDVSVNDLKGFRQLHSKTAGHPEYGHTPGVEITTGPLGQGVANAVGFAIAESYMAAKFNKPDYNLFDHYTYVLCGDGCLQEGVACEAVSLAGTLGLGKLILLYDSNNITIEGDTAISFTEDVGGRFEACGWHVQFVAEGNDLSAIHYAVEAAKNVKDKPSIIEVKTIIGFGAPKQGTHSVHGSPLGDDGIKAAKQNLGWTYEEPFYVPEEVIKASLDWQKEAAENETNWNRLYEKYLEAYPNELKDWENVSISYEDFPEFKDSLATRQSSQVVLNLLSEKVQCLIGGAADLAPSTLSLMKNRTSYCKDNRTGTNLHFGVREHAMTAIANGLAAYGGFRPYVAGFFVFSDYMKPAMRLAAMMKLPVVYIMTHDSIGVGEDGPTHQPVEQLASLRSIPGFTVFRPCDTKETTAAWVYAMNKTDGPTALVLSRQTLPLLAETSKEALRGAYVLKDSEKPDVLLIASGSEVELAYKAKEILSNEAIHVRIVSMPSMEVFDQQSDEYKESVLPKAMKARLVIEAASSFGWHKYAGFDGDVIAIDEFGASAPAGTLFIEYGFTAEAVAERARKVYEKNR